MIGRRPLSVISFCLYALCAKQLPANEPIAIFAASGGMPPIELTVSSQNITSLVEQVTERQNEFIAFAGLDFAASFTYLGVPNTILFDFSANGLSAVVTIPSANFQRTFTALDPEELSELLQDFLKSEGTDELSKLRKFVNTVSPSGISDGNPFSTTALLSANWGETFSTWQSTAEQRGQFQLSYAQASYEAGDFTGSLQRGALNTGYQISDSLGLLMTLPFNYQLIENSELFGVGAGFALPYTLVKADQERPYSWIIAPYFGGMFRISEDLASGGAVFDYGLHTRFSYHFSQVLIITTLVQYEDFLGLPLTIEEYELDSDIEQQLLTLGLELDYRLIESLRLKAHIHSMHYQQAAAVDNWLQSGLKLNYTPFKNQQIGIGYQRIEASNFNADNFTANFLIRF